METLTPNEIFDKQSRRINESVDDVKRGVQRTTINPMERAAANKGKALRNYQQAINDGTWEESLRAVPVDEWKRLTIAKADRIPQGVTEAKDKIVAFHAQRAEHQKRIDADLEKMPTNTPSDMEARMLVQIRKMRDFRFKRR